MMHYLSNNPQHSPNKRTLIEQQIMIFAREQSFKISTPFYLRFETNSSCNLYQITLFHIKASVAHTGDFNDHYTQVIRHLNLQEGKCTKAQRIHPKFLGIRCCIAINN